MSEQFCVCGLSLGSKMLRRAFRPVKKYCRVVWNIQSGDACGEFAGFSANRLFCREKNICLTRFAAGVFKKRRQIAAWPGGANRSVLHFRLRRSCRRLRAEICGAGPGGKRSSLTYTGRRTLRDDVENVRELFPYAYRPSKNRQPVCSCERLHYMRSAF